MKSCEAQGSRETGRSGGRACAEQPAAREDRAEDSHPQASPSHNHAEQTKSEPKGPTSEVVDDAVEEPAMRCPHCSTNFHSEEELHPHVLQCRSDAKLKEAEKEKEYTFTEDVEEGDAKDNTVTPVKSWLKKHLDSVKIPETKKPKSQKPLYIIPQEPEERMLSSASSSEDEDSQSYNKKSPRGRGRPKQAVVEDDSKQSSGGLKVKFSKSAYEAEFAKTINQNTGYSYKPEAVEKQRTKSIESTGTGYSYDPDAITKKRPKGSKSKAKQKKSFNQNITPKKIVLKKSGVPNPPNKAVPAKQTTPSPPLVSSPPVGLSYGLAPAMGPALDVLSRPKSGSPEAGRARRLSESSSDGNGSESEPDDIEVVKTINVVTADSPKRTEARSSFEEAFVKSLETPGEDEDNEPILEVCPENMQGLDENDILGSDEEELGAMEVLDRSTDRVSLDSRDLSVDRSRSCSPVHSTSPLRERSSSGARSSRSPSPSRARSVTPQKSLASSSSSSSSSDSSSEDSRASSPAPAQLPIPKIKIKLASLPSPKSKSYKPVKVFGSKLHPSTRKPSNNNLVNKLRSLSCQVDMPRLRFRNRDTDSEEEAEIRLHHLDIKALPGCQATRKVPMSLEKAVAQPPIAPLKIRLRSPAETVPMQTGQSLFSVLEQIAKRPRLKATVPSKEYKDFILPVPEQKAPEGLVFSSSLTKSIAVLTKFAEAEICHNIIEDIVSKIEERKYICENIVTDILNGLFESELDSDKLIEDKNVDEEVECIAMDEDSSIELSDSECSEMLRDVLGNPTNEAKTSLEEKTMFEEGSADELLCEPDMPDIDQSDDSKEAFAEQIENETPIDQSEDSNEAFAEQVEEEPPAKEETVPILKIKKPAKVTEKKSPIKLVIKPIKPMVDDPVDNDMDLSSCISDSESETKNPRIIVKIPKASLSPTKKVSKNPLRANSKLTKTPSVTIKNLKILPFFQPLPRPDSTSSASPSSNKSKADKKSSRAHATEKNQEGQSKAERRAAKQDKLDRKLSKSAFTVTSKKNKDSKVTVLKMTNKVALSRKQEAQEKLERKSDLERMLEDERKRKSEEVKKQREDKKEILQSPIAKKSSVAKDEVSASPLKSYESESDSVKKNQKERRSSLSKTREQWVVTPRIKTPSPTPMPFVAKKSRPDETVSFSLPPGGFKSDSCSTSKSDSKAKPLPWFAKVDDLFSQYYPAADEDKNNRATSFTESDCNIEDEEAEEINSEQATEVDSRSLIEDIIEELLDGSISMQDSRPGSSARSRACSGDSLQSETSSSLRWNESHSSKSQKARRRTEDLGEFLLL